MWCGTEGRSSSWSKWSPCPSGSFPLLGCHSFERSSDLFGLHNEVWVQLSVHKCPDFFPLGRTDRVPGPRLHEMWGEEDTYSRAYWGNFSKVTMCSCMCLCECVYVYLSVIICECVMCVWIWWKPTFPSKVRSHILVSSCDRNIWWAVVH